MIALDDEQLSVFADKASTEFIDKMVTYVSDNYPMIFARVGRAKVEQHSRTTFDEAKLYGFETERQIVSYLDLGMRFGRIPKAEWAQPSLDTSAGKPERRMRNLQHAALRHHRMARP